MKIYAKQVNPEYQESPLFNDEYFHDNIAVFGNCDFQEHIPDNVQCVINALKNGELSSALENIGSEYSWYKNATEAINDFIPRENGKRYSTHAVHKLKNLIDEWDTCTSSEEPRVICCILDIVTDMEWDWCEINGSCQGDWNMVYYPANKWTIEALDAFECEYFNTGSEWIVSEEHEEPEDPDDIYGYSVYVHGYDAKSIKEEIAQYEGVKAEDVVLYEFSGYQKTPIYKVV